ncbi:MAG: ABC transporter ATP-binding protein [Lachnospiraceae bacterium]|nr:ABC transporter ATP-binding protein [Lachnospiraceae bacterium]RKI62733.1 ABC transporter ATP-binding protein [bacterium D16-51]RKI62738.1 ABC transporter ATP-binding protein [bacterium D16-51]
MVKAEHIFKSIHVGQKEEKILTDVSFVLEKNTITAIVGKSGCGKSTLLSIMSGIDKPSAGKVFLGGKDFYSLDKKRQEQFRNENIGILFQNYHLIPELTCEENIRMPLVFSSKKIENGKVKKMMESVGLEKKRKLYPKQMSGGEQQRTAIVRALVNKPSILYADEPTGALDSETGNSVIKFLVKCAHEQGLTVLLVTHDMGIAKQCDQIIKMQNGKIYMP